MAIGNLKHSFFSKAQYHGNLIKYIHDPLSRDLMIQDKCKAVAWSVIFSVFLGMAHLVSYYLAKRKITNETYRHTDKQYRFQKVTNKTKDVAKERLINFKRNKTPDARNSLGETIQTNFIKDGYDTLFPSRSNIEIIHPKTNQKTTWGTLSREDKVNVNNKHALEHNKLHGIRKFFVDYFVAPPGHNQPYLLNDPRQIHGIDHSVRTAIFLPVFLTLYLKYFAYSFTEEELIAAQLTAAGHDLGRQADGTDLFDKESARRTADILSEILGPENSFVEKARNAISKKDSISEINDLFTDCLQNADSADFVRTLSTKKNFGMRLSKKQSKKEFEKSKTYLNIYQQAHLKALEANGNFNPKKILRTIDNVQLSFEDFEYELESIRLEMNDFIYLTHNKQMRSQISSEGKIAYNEMLSLITPSEFPLLCNTLEMIGVKPSYSSFLKESWKNHVDNLYLLLEESNSIGFLTEKERNDYLLKIVEPDSLNNLDASYVRKAGEIKEKINLMTKLQESYETAKKDPSNIDGLLSSYGALLPAQKDSVRDDMRKTSWKNSEPTSDEIRSAIADLEHNEDYTKCALNDADSIIKRYKKIENKLLKDPRHLSTAALIYKKEAEQLLKNSPNKAYELLKKFTEIMPDLDQDFKLNFKKLFDETYQTMPRETFSLLRGALYLRHHRLRISETISLENKKSINLFFELTSQKRNELEGTLKKLKDSLLSDGVIIDSQHEEFSAKNNGKILDNKEIIAFGKETSYTFKTGIKVRIGADQGLMNQYHIVHVDIPQNCSINEAHKALSLFGLPMALLPPRISDLTTNAQNRISKLFDNKTDISTYANKSVMKAFGGHYVEQTFPSIADRVKSSDGEILSHFIWGGDIQKISDVVSSVLRYGTLSSIERYEKGILGYGYVPKLNYKTGSANQVFTRTLTKQLCEKSKSFSDFPLNSKVLLLIDVKAFERTPYFTFDDRGGLRNPKYHRFLPWFSPMEGLTFRYEGKIPKYEGHAALKDRPLLDNFLTGLQQTTSFGNETVFNNYLDPEYFLGLAVENAYNKRQLITGLERKGIRHINGLELEKAVIITNKGVTIEKVNNLRAAKLNKESIN